MDLKISSQSWRSAKTFYDEGKKKTLLKFKAQKLNFFEENMCHGTDFSFPFHSVFSFLIFGNVWYTFMPCNDIKEMLKLYIFYAVCGVGVFGSHLITQILTSSHFHKNERVENDCNEKNRKLNEKIGRVNLTKTKTWLQNPPMNEQKSSQCFYCHNFLSFPPPTLMHIVLTLAGERESLKIEK